MCLSLKPKQNGYVLLSTYLQTALYIKNPCVMPTGLNPRQSVALSGISPQCFTRASCGSSSWRAPTRSCSGSAGPTTFWWRTHCSCSSSMESLCKWWQDDVNISCVMPSQVICCKLVWIMIISSDVDYFQNSDIRSQSSCRWPKEDRQSVTKANWKCMHNQTKVNELQSC